MKTTWVGLLFRILAFAVPFTFFTASTILATTLRAGAAKRVITPEMSVYLAGLGNNRLSVGVHDDIYTRCLMLNDGETKIGIVSLDLIGLTMQHTLKIRQLLSNVGIDGENIILTCTHQHSGPDTIGLWGPTESESGVNLRYIEYVYGQIVESIKEAGRNMEPAILKLASVQVPEGVSRNVREPELIDRELSLLKVDSPSGETIATLINFTAHPETLWSDNLLVTADYPGYVYRDVEEKLGGVALFVNGALGGMVTVDSKSNTFEEAERIGSTVAEKAIEAAQKAEVQENVKIVLKKEKIQVPMENPGFIALMEAGILPEHLLIDGKVRTEVNLIEIGDAQIATFPGEALPKLGLSAKTEMKAKYKFIFGLTNDELGYILPEADFNLELYKYEKSMSVGSKIGTIITEKLLMLISGAEQNKLE
jgi:hypothetical protein